MEQWTRNGNYLVNTIDGAELVPIGPYIGVTTDAWVGVCTLEVLRFPTAMLFLANTGATNTLDYEWLLSFDHGQTYRDVRSVATVNVGGILPCNYAWPATYAKLNIKSTTPGASTTYELYGIMVSVY